MSRCLEGAGSQAIACNLKPEHEQPHGPARSCCQEPALGADWRPSFDKCMSSIVELDKCISSTVELDKCISSTVELDKCISSTQ